MTSRWAVGTALALAFAPASALAQRSARIVVVDDQGAPVPLADVRVTGAAGEQNALTAEDGAAAVDLATVTAVEVSAPGKVGRVLTGEELAGSGFRVVLEDEQSAGSEIVVQGRRISSAYTPQTIGKLEILTDPLAKADALLAVANLPGSTNADGTADIQLRGSAAALSRAYFNDVPLYEVVRGSPVDRATRGFSVFNSSIIQDVEVYPTNPPLYLANSSGGAVRILPDDADSGSSTVYASLAGAGLTRTIPLGADSRNQTQLYVTVTELEPLLALNPRLRDVTESFRAAAVGASTSLHPDDRTRIGLLNVFDGERGRFPYLRLGEQDSNANDRLRSYNVLTVERGVGEVRLKVDAAYSEVRGRQIFDAFRTRTRNSYAYLAADVAGTLSPVPLEYRVGLSNEAFRFRSRGSTMDDFGRPIGDAFELRQRAGNTAAFAYLTLRPAKALTVAVGTRQPLQGHPDQAASYQATATLALPDGRQKIIVGAGRYSSLVLPDSFAFDRPAAATSRQVSIDYKFETRSLRASLGVYAKEDTLAGREIRIRGMDAFVSTDIGDGLSVLGSFTTARPVVRDRGLRYRADNYLSYLLRLSLRAEVTRTTAVAASFVGRSGTPYSEVVGASGGIEGPSTPMFAALPNQRTLAPFRTVDLNLTNIMTWWPGPSTPIGFVSVTNLLDRRNPSRVDFDPATSSERELYYQRRAVTFGIVFQL